MKTKSPDAKQITSILNGSIYSYLVEDKGRFYIEKEDCQGQQEFELREISALEARAFVELAGAERLLFDVLKEDLIKLGFVEDRATAMMAQLDADRDEAFDNNPGLSLS